MLIGCARLVDSSPRLLDGQLLFSYLSYTSNHIVRPLEIPTFIAGVYRADQLSRICLHAIENYQVLRRLEIQRFQGCS